MCQMANVSGEIAVIHSEFLNVFILTYGYVDEGLFVSTSTHLIIDIWEHDPAAGIKTCHQWTFIDNNADDNLDTVYAESFRENRWNILQGIEPIPILAEGMERYSELFRRCLRYLLKRLGLPSIAEIYGT